LTLIACCLALACTHAAPAKTGEYLEAFAKITAEQPESDKPQNTVMSTISPAAVGDGEPTPIEAPSKVDTKPAPYSAKVFLHQAGSIPWRLGGATLAITLTGVANWDWGSSPFHFHDEGWVGKDTKSLGMDKLGHGWSAFVLTEFFTDGIERAATDRRHASYTAGLLAMGLMTYIEVFDGYSKDHGFSPQDLTMDAAGITFSLLRRAVPGLRDTLDFRLLYTPDQSTFESLKCFPRPSCKHNGIVAAHDPVTDYSNQRYVLALKLAGFKPLAPTPLRLLELQGGYYARGFTADAELRGVPLRRRLFFGLGLNVGELLFPRPHGWFQKGTRSGLEYLQVPHTAIYSQ
jgi:Predicted periplasmic lipoprotein (DUF2279)